MATPCQNYLQTAQTQLDAQILSNPYLLPTNQYQKHNESKLILLTITKLLHHILHNREISERLLIQNKNILNKIQEQQTQINHIQQIKELNNNNNTTILEELSAEFSSVRGDVHEMASTIVNSDEYAAKKIKCLLPKMFQCLERNITNNIIRHTNQMIRTIYNNTNNTPNISQQTQPPTIKPTDHNCKSPESIANQQQTPPNHTITLSTNKTQIPAPNISLHEKNKSANFRTKKINIQIISQPQSKSSELITNQQQTPPINTTTCLNKPTDTFQSILFANKSQNNLQNDLQTKLQFEKSNTKLLQSKSLQINTNKQQTSPNITTTLQIKPIDPTQTTPLHKEQAQILAIYPSQTTTTSPIKLTELPIEHLNINEKKLKPLQLPTFMDTSSDENNTKSSSIDTVTTSPINPLCEKRKSLSKFCPNKRGQIKLINQPQTKSQNSLDSSTILQLSTDENININPPSVSDNTSNNSNIKSLILSNKPSSIKPLREKRNYLNKSQINRNTIKTKQKKKKIKNNNNNKHKNKIKKQQKNKKKTKINKKNKNILNNNKKPLIGLKIDKKEDKYDLIKFKNDEIENYIINHKFTADQFDDWFDYKQNIKNITAKEYYELSNGIITDMLIKEWLDSYRSTRLNN